MNPEEITYALAKQVPSMAQRGFVIGTSYGELAIEYGPLAERIAAAVKRELEAELQRLQATTAPGADAPLTAEAIQWLDDYATGKLPSAQAMGVQP